MPSQNASFLQHLAATDLTSRPDPQELVHSTDPQAVYDAFYAFASGLLDTFYPECTVTVTSRDLSYVTPEIKAKLRRKNRLMHARRVEEAGALARQIGRDITGRSKHQLSNTKKTSAKKLWKAVRQLTGRKHDPAFDPSIMAAKLNQHYANVSTDASYTSVRRPRIVLAKFVVQIC